MTYEDVGYDSSLLRSLTATYTEQIGIDSISSYQQISGSQISGDTISSLNNTAKYDLQNDRFYVNDGVVDRVELGRLSDGSIGFIVRNSDGNELVRVSENSNVFQSADQTLTVDFNNAQIVVRDAGKVPIVLMGKLS